MWGGSWEGRKSCWCQHVAAYLLRLQQYHTAHLSKDLRNPTSISSPMTVSRQILFLTKTGITCLCKIPYCVRGAPIYTQNFTAMQE